MVRDSAANHSSDGIIGVGAQMPELVNKKEIIGRRFLFCNTSPNLLDDRTTAD